MFIHVSFEGLNIWGKGQIVASSLQNSATTKEMRGICLYSFRAACACSIGFGPSFSKQGLGQKKTQLQFGCQAPQLAAQIWDLWECKASRSL